MTSTSTVSPPADSVATGLLSRFTGVPVGVDDLDRPLASLGLDSLQVVELTAIVEDTLGATIDPERITVLTTLRELVSAHPAERRASDDVAARMVLDATLPSDFDVSAPTTVRRTPPLDTARHILLTGATGLLGGRLAADLLARTGADLTCVVRPRGPASGRERLTRNLQAHGASSDAITARVRVLAADLTSLSHRTEWAPPGIDAVVHAAADVNWVASYDALRAANVAGTLALLRLAWHAGRVPFHFVSSLSVCYPHHGPQEADERFVPISHAGSLHLGYAQTKAVAESLALAASARGLPVTIYRPALVAGASDGGPFNPHDLLTTMIRGCVQMGTAPDLDWAIDCLPVDVAAREMVALSGAGLTVVHLLHDRPRHWRECLLWMRRFGYPVTLVAYDVWSAQLTSSLQEAERLGRRHALAPLAPFLRRRVGSEGLTLPQLYERHRCTRAVSPATSRALGGVTPRPSLDARLLARYFDAFIGSGILPRPTRPRVHASDAAGGQFSVDDFTRWLRRAGLREQVRSATRLEWQPDDSIIGELTAWGSGLPPLLSRYRLEFANPRSTREVVVKLKPPDTRAIEIGYDLAQLCDPAVAREYRRWRHRLDLVRAGERELAVYRMPDARLVRHRPALLGYSNARNRRLLVLDYVDDLESVGAGRTWTDNHVAVAVRDLARIHSVWYGRTARIRNERWLPHVHTAQSMIEMRGWWEVLAAHAAPRLRQWGDDDLPRLHARLVQSIERWRPDLEAATPALIHNDCNPRNVCLRGRGRLRLCAYDWELATIGAPQRDLAELLAFTLPADASSETVADWVEFSRRSLARVAGAPIDRRTWQRGFAAAVCDLMVNRLSMLVLIDRVREQAFLPRIVSAWRRLYESTAGAGWLE